jgi:hypothetical protein
VKCSLSLLKTSVTYFTSNRMVKKRRSNTKDCAREEKWEK